MYERINTELMFDVHRYEVEALRKENRSLKIDRKILVDAILKKKPELTEWVKLNFGGKYE